MSFYTREGLDLLGSLALKDGDLDAVASINESLEKHGNKGHPESALHMAARLGLARHMQALVDLGIPVNGRSEDGLEPIHVASSRGTLSALEKLIELGADVNARDMNHSTVVHHLVKGTKSPDRESKLELLIQHGASIREVDQSLWSPIHRAAFNKLARCVQMFVAHGEDVNVVIPELGSTPLFMVCDDAFDVGPKADEGETVRTLLDLGANVSAQRNDGTSPVSAAIQRDGFDETLLCRMIDCGYELDQVDQDGRSALHHAMTHLKFGSARHLIMRGANVNAQDNRGLTPIHVFLTEAWPVEMDSTALSMMISLLEAGADPYIQDKEGKCAMDSLDRCPIEFRESFEAARASIESKKRILSIVGKVATAAP